MEWTYPKISGLTYTVLDAALQHLGYVRHDEPERVVYTHSTETKARLLFPVFPLEEEVRGIDLLAAQKIVDGFGIMDVRNFDLLLIRLAGHPLPTLSH